jgi:hypothetical protein
LNQTGQTDITSNTQNINTSNNTQNIIRSNMVTAPPKQLVTIVSRNNINRSQLSQNINQNVLSNTGDVASFSNIPSISSNGSSTTSSVILNQGGSVQNISNPASIQFTQLQPGTVQQSSTTRTSNIQVTSNNAQNNPNLQFVSGGNNLNTVNTGGVRVVNNANVSGGNISGGNLSGQVRVVNNNNLSQGNLNGGVRVVNGGNISNGNLSGGNINFVNGGNVQGGGLSLVNGGQSVNNASSVQNFRTQQISGSGSLVNGSGNRGVVSLPSSSSSIDFRNNGSIQNGLSRSGLNGSGLRNVNNIPSILPNRSRSIGF